jgi:hypothetical protein
MTAATADAARGRTPVDRLRRRLLADAALLALAGTVLLLAAAPLAGLAGAPGLLRAMGVVLVVLGADLALASGWAARRLAARRG